MSLPLVFLHLLADRNLNPGGVLISFKSESSEILQNMAANSEFVSFAKSIPCFITESDCATVPESVSDALKTAGCQRLENSALHRADSAEKPELLAPAQWLSGTWYLTHPAKPVSGQASSRTLALKLVQLISADADTREIEEVFRQDPSLSYHLLRLVNSLSMGANRKITSFSQAILMLGRQQLKRWLNLMLFAARKDDHRAAMLLARVAVRARCMEVMAKEIGLDRANQELSFMAGMFSLLGVLFGMPLTEVFKPLQMSEVLVSAVLDHQGKIGLMLKLVELAEQGDAPAIEPVLTQLGLCAADMNRVTLEAFQWMLGVTRDAQGTSHA